MAEPKKKPKPRVGARRWARLKRELEQEKTGKDRRKPKPPKQT